MCSDEKTGHARGRDRRGGRSIPVYIMGKKYDVPDSLTIMKAMEYSGLQVHPRCRLPRRHLRRLRHRLPQGRRLPASLWSCLPDRRGAGMYLTQIPFYPANRAVYDIDALEPKAEERLRRSTRSCSAALPATPAPRSARWTSMSWTTSRPSSRATSKRPPTHLLRLHPVRSLHLPLHGRDAPVPHRADGRRLRGSYPARRRAPATTGRSNQRREVRRALARWWRWST